VIIGVGIIRIGGVNTIVERIVGYDWKKTVLANGIISITRPLRVAVDVANQVSAGDLTADIKATSKDEIGQLLAAMHEMTRALNEKAAAADELARGNLGIQVRARSNKDVLSKSFALLLQTLQGLVAEIDRLVQSAKAGELGTRGDTSKFQGGYRQAIQGINDTLEAIIAPIDEASTVLQHVSERDLTARMHGDYKGDYLKIKTALNQATQEMAGTLRLIGQNAGTLAGSSEELKAVSQQMSANAEIAQNISGIMQAAQNTTSGASDTQNAAGELIRMAAELQKLVAQFRYGEETFSAPLQIEAMEAERGKAPSAARTQSPPLSVRVVDDVRPAQARQRFSESFVQA
jgi:methyl-accepting chemotaxis protein